MQTLRLLFIAVLLLAAMWYPSSSQPMTDKDGDVSIGILTPDPSAILDISSTSKGILIPRFSTPLRNAIQLPASGLMIYNMDVELFEYNFGTPFDPAWTRVLTDSSLGDAVSATTWTLGGNTGTTPWDGTTGQFVGTGDDEDFVLATGGVEQARMYSPLNGGGFGITGAFRPDGMSGIAGQVLVSQGPNNAPTWESAITLDNLSVGDVNVSGTSAFSALPSMPLNQGNILVGNALNRAAPLTPGAMGTVLQINGSGVPAWQVVPMLPAGTTMHSTLVWDGASWIENTNVTLNAGSGDVMIGGDLVVSGASATLPSGSVDNSELANSSINLSYGAGITGGASVSLGGTLNLQNTGVTSIAGTINQVNVSSSTGAVTVSLPQNIDHNATPTFDAIVLDNLAVGSNATDVIVSNGGVLESRTLNSIVAATTLNESSLWVGNVANNPIELPVGSEGQVLTIVGGTPTWASGASGATDVNTASTSDESFAIRGTASGNTANQVAGVWGRATDPSNTNTGTIGVLATGNGNTTAGETNVALQINDGEFTVGRTTETGSGYSVVEAATAGTLYSAEGPSGVIEFNLSIANSSPLAAGLVGTLNTLGTPLGSPTLGNSINGLLGLSVFNTTLTVNNRFVTPESIVLVHVVDIADTDPIADLLGLFQNGTLTASTVVTNRQNGSFDFTIDLRLLGATTGVNNGAIRVGYLIVNPSR